MWARLSFLAFLVLFGFQAFADDYELAPRIFVYKSTGPTVVVGGDFVINYLVINNGDAKARDIQISDKYDPSLFTGLANIDENGEVTFNLDELDVNEKVSFNATVSPKLHGIYESTRARVKYSSGAITKTEEEEDGENADDPMLGFSTSMGKIRILSVEAHMKASSRHYLEWCVFFVSVVAAVAIPGNIWRTVRKAKKN